MIIDEFHEILKSENPDVECLYKLAESYVITLNDIRDNYIHVNTHGAGMFWSQGYGACKYAEVSANLESNIFMYFGIPSKIEEVKLPDVKCVIGSQKNAEYRVFAKCSKELATLIKYKTVSISIVKELCDKPSINLKVLFPFMK